MCTVTFVPQTDNTYILTSNRDEQVDRTAPSLFTKSLNGQTVIFPREPKAGGTWIAASNENRIVCILNGAFINHRIEKGYPFGYRRSRGLMALDYYFFDSIHEFSRSYLFKRIEPFTMIVIENESLYDFKWDGKHQHIKKLAFDQKHIWSSAPLYDDSMKKLREKWFASWQKNTPNPQLEDIQRFHYHAGEGNPATNVIMKRPYIGTVSVTHVIQKDGITKMKHHELQQDLQEELSLDSPQLVNLSTL
ncbi:MAG: NRDE family protein [Bacteroidota bacterium]